jgi:hypothetical protein
MEFGISYNMDSLFSFSTCLIIVPSNWVTPSLVGKFGTVGQTFVPVIDHLFMKISNLCKNSL